MPSASAKLEKQASAEVSDAVRNAISVIEKKIRNLEKRKSKLDQLKAERESGKTLNPEQETAIANFGDVLSKLDFLRDFEKQFNCIVSEAARHQKKQQKREQVERLQAEGNRIKEILIIQDVLQNMGQDQVRDDFLAGQQGACTLTETELKYLDDLFVIISPKRIPDDGQPSFQEQVANASEHVTYLLEGKEKEVVGTTYCELRKLLFKIHESGYFDQSADDTGLLTQAQEGAEEDYGESENTAPAEEPPLVDDNEIGEQVRETTPAAVEPSYFTPVIPVQPTPSQFASSPPSAAAVPQGQPRPISEVIGPVCGNFNFIQESQLEPDISRADVPMSAAAAPVMLVQSSVAVPPNATLYQQPSPGSPRTVSPVIAVAQPSQQPPPPEFQGPIPTQTFTNQAFVQLPQGMPQVSLQSQIQTFAGQPAFQAVAPSAVADTTPNPPPPIPMPQQRSVEEPAKYSTNLTNAAYENNTYGGVAASGFVQQQQQNQPTQQPSQPFVTSQVNQPSTQGPASTYANQASAPRHGFNDGSQQHSSEQLNQTQDGTGSFGSEHNVDSFADDGNGNTWQPANQGNEGFVQQGSRYDRGSRGSRGGTNRGRSSSNGYSGRGRGSYQNNGRGGSGYNNRYSGGGGGGNQDGNNAYYQNQNGFQRDSANYNGGGGGGGGYKRGGSGGSAPRGNRGGGGGDWTGSRGGSRGVSQRGGGGGGGSRNYGGRNNQ